jgi:hypothetical protein
MSSQNVSSRRRFLLDAGVLVALGGSVASAFGQGKKAAPATSSKDASASGGNVDLPLVDEKAALSVTLKYAADAAKVPAGVKVAKSGVEGAKQNCANCLFYAKAGAKGGQEVGKCQLFPQAVVPAKAWCASWAKRP